MLYLIPWCSSDLLPFTNNEGCDVAGMQSYVHVLCHSDDDAGTGPRVRARLPTSYLIAVQYKPPLPVPGSFIRAFHFVPLNTNITARLERIVLSARNPQNPLIPYFLIFLNGHPTNHKSHGFSPPFDRGLEERQTSVLAAHTVNTVQAG